MIYKSRIAINGKIQRSRMSFSENDAILDALNERRLFNHQKHTICNSSCLREVQSSSNSEYDHGVEGKMTYFVNDDIWEYIGPIYDELMSNSLLSESEITCSGNEKSVSNSDFTGLSQPSETVLAASDKCNHGSYYNNNETIRSNNAPSYQQVCDLLKTANEFDEWLTTKENFINNEIIFIDDLLSQSCLEDAFSSHMESQSEIKFYYKIVTALSRAAHKVSEFETSNGASFEQKITNIELKWKQLYLKSLGVQCVLEHKLSSVVENNISEDCKSVSNRHSLSSSHLKRFLQYPEYINDFSLSLTDRSSLDDIIPFESIEYRRISSNSLTPIKSQSLTMLSVFKPEESSTRRCMSLEDIPSTMIKRRDNSSINDSKRLRFKTVRLSIPVPLHDQNYEVNYDAGDEDDTIQSNMESCIRRKASRNKLHCIRNGEYQQQHRQEFSSPDTSDVETIQNLMENSHFQLNTLKQQLKSTFDPMQSTEALATCQLNVRYLEDVKTGLEIKTQRNSQLDAQLLQMDELIKYWKDMEPRVSYDEMSSTVSTDHSSISDIKQQPQKATDVKDTTSSQPHLHDINNVDNSQSIRRRRSLITSHRQDNNDYFDNLVTNESDNLEQSSGLSNYSLRTNDAIDELRHIHGYINEMSNEFLGIERTLTDCEAHLRSYENEISTTELTKEHVSAVNRSVQSELRSLSAVDKIHNKIVSMYAELSSVFLNANFHGFEQRTNRVKYRKRLLKLWCMDILHSASSYNNLSISFQCSICADIQKRSIEPLIYQCATAQQRRLHYIRNFWSASDKRRNTTPTEEIIMSSNYSADDNQHALSQYDHFSRSSSSYNIDEGISVDSFVTNPSPSYDINLDHQNCKSENHAKNKTAESTDKHNSFGKCTRKWNVTTYIFAMLLILFLLMYIVYQYMLSDCSKISYRNRIKDIFDHHYDPIC
ncbi:hypothetical protein GJ496_008216 [Pomphorhynchus laevis]|nr:hypothetical protein GJ496_008216 [Pomphorhynchus laevis]